MSHTWQINGNLEKVDLLNQAIRKLSAMRPSISNLSSNNLINAANSGWEGAKKKSFVDQAGKIPVVRLSIDGAISTAISDYNQQINSLNAQINTWRELDRQEALRR